MNKSRSYEDQASCARFFAKTCELVREIDLTRTPKDLYSLGSKAHSLSTSSLCMKEAPEDLRDTFKLTARAMRSVGKKVRKGNDFDTERNTIKENILSILVSVDPDFSSRATWLTIMTAVPAIGYEPVIVPNTSVPPGFFVAVKVEANGIKFISKNLLIETGGSIADLLTYATEAHPDRFGSAQLRRLQKTVVTTIKTILPRKAKDVRTDVIVDICEDPETDIVLDFTIWNKSPKDRGRRKKPRVSIEKRICLIYPQIQQYQEVFPEYSEYSDLETSE
jgi:hypothetical protein